MKSVMIFVVTVLLCLILWARLSDIQMQSSVPQSSDTRTLEKEN